MTRGHSALTSAMLWLVRMTVASRSSLYLRMKSRTIACIDTSRPIVGSSRNSTLGRARATRELALHPLAERELPRRPLDHVPDPEELHDLFLRFVERLAREPINRAIELERLRRGQIPNELLLLPEHQRDLPQERFVPPLGSCPSTRASPAVG